MTHASSTLPVGRGIWYVGIAATAWGTGGAAAAVLYTLTGLGPVAVSWWRFLSGFLLLAAARRWAGPRRAGPREARLTARSWRTILVTGIGLAVYQTAYYVAIDLAGLAVATVVTLGAGPVLIAVGGHLTGIERLTRGAVTAVAAALAGLVLLTGTGPADTPTAGAHRIAGIGFALLSAAGYAVVTLLTRRGGTTLHRYDAALGGFAVGAVLLAPLAVTQDLTIPTGTGEIALLLYLALVPTALAYALFFAGLAVVKATTASVVALVEPVTATLVAVALLDEVLKPTTTAGSALLLSAVVALVVAERKPARRARARPERMDAMQSHPNVRAVQEALDANGARTGSGEPSRIVVLTEAAPTAAAAAEALGIEVGQIANSLIFDADGAPLLVLTSGAHRVDTAKVAADLGVGKLRRASADFVKEHTGQAIGGVAPLGHPRPVRTLVDTDLLAYAEVWAAGGIPHAVVPIAPAELVRVTGGTVTTVA
jgi:drug/metabolite transporter, DME family